jgi:hypothetical protein
MANKKVPAYVDSASALHGLTLKGEERDRVILQFERLAEIAAPLLAVPIQPDDEPAPVFEP